jgi:hypothetical protein
MITSCKVQKITYQPMGIMDKPLPQIFIGNKCEHSELNCFILNKSDLDILIGFISENYSMAKLDSVGITYPYGAYKIIIKEGHKQKYIILLNKKQSQAFFENQLPYLKNNEKLVKRILLLINRLK